MIVAETGEDADVEPAVADALEREAVRAGLDHGVGAAVGGHLGEQGLHDFGFRRRLARLVAPPFAADVEFDAVDQPAAMARGFEDRVRQVGGRALAVGAGHADDLEVFGGESVPGGGEVGQRGPRVLNLDHRDVGIRRLGGPDLARVGLDDDRGRAGCDGLRDVLVPVGAFAADGDEAGTGAGPAGILHDLGDPDRCVAAEQAVPGLLEQR